MESVQSMNRNELLRGLQQHKKYHDLSQKKIGEQLGSIDNLRHELNKLNKKTKKSKKSVVTTMNNDQPLPQLPNEIISSIVPIDKSMLINKQYTRNIQKQYDEYYINKARKDIYDFIVSKWYMSDIRKIDDRMRDYGHAGYFEDEPDKHEFYAIQKSAIDNLPLYDVIFYKKLINMIKHKNLLFVDEENYGYNRIDLFAFTSEGKLILHE